jgi:hypothetical protein
MTVDAKLGVVRKVGAELQKERSEVFVHTIEVVVIDHGRGFHDPRIARTGALTAATLGAHDTRFLLRLVDIEHALAFFELPQVRLCDDVLALALLKGNEINDFAISELLDVANERPSSVPPSSWRQTAGPVDPQISQHASYGLQVWHIDVEVHPVDRLVLKHNMLDQRVRHGSCYPHRGLRSSTGPRTHRASSSYIQGMSLQVRPESTQIERKSSLSSAHAVPIYLVGLRRSLVRF